MISITDHHIDEPETPWLPDLPYRITITGEEIPIRPRAFTARFGDVPIFGLTMQLDGTTLVGWMGQLPDLNDTLSFGYEDEPLIETGL